MTSADAYDGYTALIPAGVDTHVAARVNSLLAFHRPVREAHRVRCPALIQVCRRDTVAPTASAEEAAARMKLAEVRHYDAGHFDIYRGDLRAASIRDALDFLRRHVPAEAATRSPSDATRAADIDAMRATTFTA